MKALDTNVLIRFLVRDDKRQADTVLELFRRAEADKEEFYVPVLVVLETIWVLESVYEIEREEILNSIEELLLLPILKFEGQSTLRSFLLSAQESNTELSDLLIANSARASGCECVVTFDKKASRFALFDMLK